MNRMEVLHGGGPTPAQSFRAKMDDGGRIINLEFGDGRTSQIVIGEMASPIEMLMVSVDSQVILCWLANQKCRYFEASTGRPLITDRSGKHVRGYRPKFYK